jgi:heme a synthase
MSIDRRRSLQIVALLGAVFAYTTIVLGGTVSGLDAGRACPDWPLCHGSLVPNLANPLVAVEYAHRLAAALTTLFLFVTFLVSVLWFRSERWLVTLSVAALAILVTQVGFGALAIMSNLDWAIVTVHLALGTATFATSLSVTLLAFVRLPPIAPEGASPD